MSRTARLSPRRADHDALFDARARVAFCAALTGAGVSYNALAADLERSGLPRPSAGSAAYRARILQTVAALGRPEVWEITDRMAQLFDAHAHAASAPPADPEGYAAALIADLPALCGDGAGFVGTDCAGVRVLWLSCAGSGGASNKA
jgi:hypothetical protein